MNLVALDTPITIRHLWLSRWQEADPRQSFRTIGVAAVPTALVDDVCFKFRFPSDELPNVIKQIYAARTTSNALMTDYRLSVGAKSVKNQQQIRDKIFHSPCFWLATAIASAKEFDFLERPTLNDCLALAHQQLIAVTNEASQAYLKAKHSGGFRVIHKFGHARKTAQFIVVDLLSPHFRPRTFQNGFDGRGTAHAIRLVKAYLKAGYVHYAKLDIRDFFSSFQLEELVSELPLQQEVVERVVTARHQKMLWEQEKSLRAHKAPTDSPPIESADIEARRGIPKGSSCSPLVGAFCLSRLAWQTTPGVVLVNYADDFLLLSTSASLLEKAVQEITDAVEGVPGGNFFLKLKGQGVATGRFDFLGYQFQLVSGQLKTSPTEANYSSISAKLARIDDQLGKKAHSLGAAGPKKTAACVKLLAKMVAIADGWIAYAKECDDLKSYTTALVIPIFEWTQKLDVTLEEIKLATEPSMKYRPADYALG